MPRRPPPTPTPRPQPHDPANPLDDAPLEDPGRPLALRLLGLFGALAFVLLGLSSLVPLFQAPPQRPLPDQRPGQLG